MELHTKKTVAAFSAKSWESKAFTSLSETLSSLDARFPCTLGVAGFNADQLRYVFIDANPTTSSALETLAAYLQSFLSAAREFGKNTSLVAFFNESRDLGIEEYEQIFWGVLNRLTLLDTKPWPIDIPKETESSHWEFCFGGEAIFVVCNTPSHRLRKSRYGSFFNITFQPRWVFDGLIGPDAPNSDKVKSEIRRRLDEYDVTPPSPYLGSYGEPGNVEWRQYFLRETDVEYGERCPFHKSASIEHAQVNKTSITNLEKVISTLLPTTGSVEVQFDTPFRRHSPHRHPTSETLHIVNGEITFEVDGKSLKCGPGDRLLLPCNTLHASTAGGAGCRYVIATRLVTSDLSLSEVDELQNV